MQDFGHIFWTSKLESTYLDRCDYYYDTKKNSIVKYDRFTKKWSSKIDIDVKV